MVEDSELTGNVSSPYPGQNPSEGGAMHIEDNASATLVRARVVGNYANTGGGLNAYRGRYDIFDSVIDSNQATNGFGGGIAATSNTVAQPARPASIVNLTQTLVRRNYASGGGGGIAIVGDNFSGFRANVSLVSIRGRLQPGTTAGRRDPAGPHQSHGDQLHDHQESCDRR